MGIIYLCENLIFYSRSKHFKIDYHFIHDKTAKKKIQIHFIMSNDQLIDVLTKPLLNASFTHFRLKLHVKSLPLAWKEHIIGSAKL